MILIEIDMTFNTNTEGQVNELSEREQRRARTVAIQPTNEPPTLIDARDE
jgi:hypothetical protein